MDEVAAVEELHLQDAVEPSHGGIGEHELAEQGVAEGHAGTDEGGGEAEDVVAVAEDGVVDLFADGIEVGHVGVEVLGYPMGLDGMDIGIGKGIVDFTQVGGVDEVVGIDYQGEVVTVGGEGLQSGFEGLGVGALLKIDPEHLGTELTEHLVGLGLHVVGDDDHIVLLLGVVLVEAVLHGGADDTVFAIGGYQHGKAMVSGIGRSGAPTLALRCDPGTGQGLEGGYTIYKQVGPVDGKEHKE